MALVDVDQASFTAGSTGPAGALVSQYGTPADAVKTAGGVGAAVAKGCTTGGKGLELS